MRGWRHRSVIPLADKNGGPYTTGLCDVPKGDVRLGSSLRCSCGTWAWITWGWTPDSIEAVGEERCRGTKWRCSSYDRAAPRSGTAWRSHQFGHGQPCPYESV